MESKLFKILVKYRKQEKD